MMFKPDDQYNEEDAYWRKKMREVSYGDRWKELAEYLDDKGYYLETELIDDENLLALAKQYNEAQEKILEIFEKRRELYPFIYGLAGW